LEAIIYERPIVCEVAEDIIGREGLVKRVKIFTGNMWLDPFPSQADVHFYCDILHDWPFQKCKFLLKKSYEYLSPGGRIIIHEMLFNNSKTGPASTAIYNFDMLLWTEGQQFTSKELSAMLQEIGFEKIESFLTGFGEWGIVTGVKKI
jgi:hypothetical protein